MCSYLMGGKGKVSGAAILVGWTVSKNFLIFFFPLHTAEIWRERHNRFPTRTVVNCVNGVLLRRTVRLVWSPFV